MSDVTRAFASMRCTTCYNEITKIEDHKFGCAGNCKIHSSHICSACENAFRQFFVAALNTITIRDPESPTLVEDASRMARRMMVEHQEMFSGQANDDTEKQFPLPVIIAGCKNLGVDITCGKCAGIFFTGTYSEFHDEGCKTLGRGNQ